MLEAGDILIRRGLIDQQQLDSLRLGGGSASSLVDCCDSTGHGRRRARPARVG